MSRFSLFLVGGWVLGAILVALGLYFRLEILLFLSLIPVPLGIVGAALQEG